MYSNPDFFYEIWRTQTLRDADRERLQHRMQHQQQHHRVAADAHQVRCRIMTAGDELKASLTCSNSS